MLFDTSESGGWASKLRNERVLINSAFGDGEVTYIASEILARSLNANSFNNSSPIFGIPQLNASEPVTSGSMFSEWDYGVAPIPDINIPPNTNTHMCVARYH